MWIMARNTVAGAQYGSGGMIARKGGLKDYHNEWNYAMWFYNEKRDN